MSNKILILPLFLGLFALSPAYAQSQVGGATLNGTVIDASQAVVTGATVKLENSETGYNRVVTSNEAGLFSFVRVPVGNYSLSVEKAGFRASKQESIALGVGAVVSLDVALSVGATSDVVTVTADVPLIESERSQASTTVNQRAIAALPVNGRNFINFTTLTPGVVTDPTRGGDLSFGGQRGPANSLLVDGGSSDNLFYGQAVGRTGFRPYSFSEEAVQEFQVNSNSYPAEIGRAGGGVINVVTKSGTNSVHGSAFWFYRDRAMNANTFTNNRANTDLGTPSYIARPAYHFNQFGGSAGGPIRKDKLFFFINYDGQRNTSPQLITPNIAVPANLTSVLGTYLNSYTTGANNEVGLVKTDWNISSNSHLNVRYNINRFTGRNFESFSGTSALEHTGDSKVNTDNIAANYSQSIGASTVLDLRYIFVKDDEPGFANTDKPETQIINGVTFGRNNFSPRYANGKTNNIIGSVTRVMGRHTMKAGADVNIAKIANYFPGFFSGSYQFASYAAFAAGTPTQYTQGFGGAGTTGPLTNPNVNEFAFYAQDAFRVSGKLTLNYGLRYDLFDYVQGTLQNTNPQLLAAGYKTDVMPVSHTNIAPRLGFAYTPFGNSRTVVRGGYGIFYARVPTILTNTALAQNGLQVRTFIILPSDPLFPKYPATLSAPPTAGTPPSIYVMQPDFISPVTHQGSLNVETALGHDLSLSVGYLGVRGKHLTRTRDVNLFPVVPVAGRLPDGSAVTLLRHPGTGGPARPNTAFGRISLFDSGADSNYNAMTVQLTKRYARNFQFLTSYTWSHVIDDVPEQTSVVVGADDSKVAQDTLNPNQDRGSGNADIRQRFVFSGVWDINYSSLLPGRLGRFLLSGWQISTIAQIQTGRHFNQLVGADVSNDGNSATDRVPGVGRNTLTGPDLQTVDVRLSRDIPVMGEKLKIRLIGEAFNATNRANFNGIQNTKYGFVAATNTFTTRTDYLRPLTSFDPRILQLAVKVIF